LGENDLGVGIVSVCMKLKLWALHGRGTSNQEKRDAEWKNFVGWRDGGERGGGRVFEF
jgi:hypothetical protein